MAKQVAYPPHRYELLKRLVSVYTDYTTIRTSSSFSTDAEEVVSLTQWSSEAGFVETDQFHLELLQ